MFETCCPMFVFFFISLATWCLGACRQNPVSAEEEGKKDSNQGRIWDLK